MNDIGQLLDVLSDLPLHLVQAFRFYVKEEVSSVCRYCSYATVSWLASDVRVDLRQDAEKLLKRVIPLAVRARLQLNSSLWNEVKFQRPH